VSAPRIVITPWRRVVPTYLGERTVLDALDPAYSDGVARAGGLPLVVPRPPDRDPDAAAEHVLELADGVLLSGGGDVHPGTYGDEDEGANADMDPAADAWEIALVRGAQRRGLPTLGICRGAQIMAVAWGGRLAQSLPPQAAHRDMAALTPEAILAERHPVDLVPGSELERALGAARVDVNTIHHHAIADAGSLRVSARAAGDLIEGVEAPDRWPAIGVQWHPEKMCEPVQHRLFDWLIRRST
jgi:putative glutamine amidotransferase